MTIRPDGYHITELGATIISEEIFEQTNKPTDTRTYSSPMTKIPQPENNSTKRTYPSTSRTYPTATSTRANYDMESPSPPKKRPHPSTYTYDNHNNKQQTNTTTLDINSNQIGHIMGRDGRTQRALERRNNVRINISSDINTDQTQTITIRGDNTNRTNTEEDIRNKIKQIRQITETKTNSTECHFYQRGNCRKGEACSYKHTTTEYRHSRSNSQIINHIPEQDHSPRHNRSQSTENRKHRTYRQDSNRDDNQTYHQYNDNTHQHSNSDRQHRNNDHQSEYNQH